MISTDLHIHSCLSPCGEDDMTPGDLVGMAKLNGLDLIALTDHNSTRNCAAAAAAAHVYGIGFIPGAEVTTSEDIHCICLFPDLRTAETFSRWLDTRKTGVLNRPEIFGRQIVVSPEGEISEEAELLITARDVSVLELPAEVHRLGGLFWPAHIDKEVNSLLAVLGMWPDELEADAAEIFFPGTPAGLPFGLPLLRSSDAHCLYTLPREGFPLPLKTPDFEGLAGYLRGRDVNQP